MTLHLSDEDIRRLAREIAVQMRGLPDALLTPEQVAAVTGLTVRALERRRSRGAAPAFVRVGPRGIRYQSSVIEAFIAGRKD